MGFLYEELQKIDEEILVYDVFFILGDFNVKVVIYNEGKEFIMGKYGCGMINNNGSICKIFVKKISLLQEVLFFNIKNIYKLMWILLDCYIQN